VRCRLHRPVADNLPRRTLLRRSSTCAPYRKHALPSSVSGTPGRCRGVYFRDNRFVQSNPQSIARIALHIVGRKQPTTSALDCSKCSGLNCRNGIFPPPPGPRTAASVNLPAVQAAFGDRAADERKVMRSPNCTASISAAACSTVTPHVVCPVTIAQSSDDAPRSPFTPDHD